MDIFTRWGERRGLITATAALMTCLAGPGARADKVYHVAVNAPTADDANPGTRERPWKTLAPAAAQAYAPGDRLSIHSGVYWDRLQLTNVAGTAAAPVTIEGVPDAGPVILKGSRLLQVNWTQITKAEPRVEPYPNAFMRRWVTDCPGPRVSQVVLSDQRFLQQIGPNDYTPDQLPLVGATVDDMFRWTFFHDVERGRLYVDVVGAPSWYHIDVARNEGAVIGLTRCRHVVVRDLEARYAGGISIMQSDHVTIEDVTVYGGARDGIALRLSRHCTVRRCRAIHNGCTGIGLSATTDCTVEETAIQENNYRRFHTGWHAGGTKNVKTVRCAFAKCVVAGNLGDGIWFDIDCQDTQIVGNRIHDNEGGGVFYEISFGQTVIANNLIYRNGYSAVYISCSSGCLIAHNTCVENGRGITVAGAGRGFEVPRPPLIDVTNGGKVWERWGGTSNLYPLAHNRILNNLLVRNGTVGAGRQESGELLIEEHPHAFENSSDWNVYAGGWWVPCMGRGYQDRRPLEVWRSATGWDRNSVVVGELAYTIDADGVFAWRDPRVLVRAIRVCPPIEGLERDIQGRLRKGRQVCAGAAVPDQ